MDIMGFFGKWINVLFVPLLWGVVFILIKPQRIRELLPVGVIAAIILFVTQLLLISLNLIRFEKAWIFVLGVPLFNPLWGAAAGILVMNYMKESFSKKIPLLFFFSAIAEAAAYAAVRAGNLSFFGEYTLMHDFIVSFVALLVLTQISEGLYGERIYHRNTL